ncbi:RNA polymerase II transcription subunit 14 mediator [Nannizzia gypsea CBS 118893]|uniref:Mediator of RNA polymerase II transcription subunit 14 n=1 Tax=Arthroderma gypseum (strain ATCC MYA-4604 / CBS 118893) TaxID=535722 RepID=E5QZ07_ARTGP|nr:RNA polymerase II transcription subunit 14 mediator [Nannizzia gypsea CBS 118893]EFQ98916.1 RNA polymerase II transcription subunit 14 mediator [Nannizzia gypsea CBS 118893]
MPGIVMDDPSAHGGWRTAGTVNGDNAASDNGTFHHTDNNSHANGRANGIKPQSSDLIAAPELPPPEIAHITQGFFPLAKGINRVVVQCWNDLLQLLSELGDAHPNAQGGSSASNASNAKKSQILEFAQAKRAEFIKLLVLSQWGRQAVDVGRLIDLQFFIRQRYDLYNYTLFLAGNIKRDLFKAQMGNPDLETALEALSTGAVSALPALPFLPPGKLSPKDTLKTLRKINKLISIRLITHDSIPDYATYHIHDGRVTFTIPNEIELDLSIAQETRNSQFFFVDLRFIFSPSSALSKGPVRDSLERTINTALMKSGIVGCCDLLHNLVLSQKIMTYFRQAIELARSHWGNNLRIELLHRTLVIQYWTNRPGPKSWIEIGTRRNKPQRRNRANQPDIPRLYVRWIRDNKEVSVTSKQLDGNIISVESILRRTISKHIHDIFFEVYTNLAASKLYGQGALFLGLNTSATEPGNCYLDVHLTRRKTLRLAIEPIGGIVALQTVPLSLNRHDVEPDSSKGLSVGTYERICRLRCLVAMEEAEGHGRVFGWKLIAPANVDMQSLRKVLPVNEIRNISLFQHKDWDPNWLVGFTSSIERDDWWVIRLQNRAEPQIRSPGDGRLIQLQQAHAVTGQCGYASNKHRYRSFAKLANAISGMVVAHSNADCLDTLKLQHSPKIENLVLGADNEVPETSVRFQASDLPGQLRVTSPLSSRGKTIIRDTVYLAYEGINHRTREAIVVATGCFAVPVSHLRMARLASDSNITFKPRSRKFSIRFLTRTGVPIITQVFSWLQQLTNTVLALEYIYRKKFVVTSISSSKISFTYPSSNGDLRASISFQYIDTPTPLLLSGSPQPTAKDDGKPLARLRMSLNLHGKNPHRRIMESLTAILNDPSAGLGFTLEFLTLTLPLLEAVETILAESSDRSRAVVRIAARSAKVYHISYPFLQYRFHLTMKQRRQSTYWLLRNGTMPSVRMSQVALESELTNKILKVNGDGWRGLGDGTMAEADKPVNLVMVLDNIIKTHVAQQRTQPEANGAGRAIMVDKTKREEGSQNSSIPAALSNNSDGTSQPAVAAMSTAGAAAPNSESDSSKQANNGSIITID